MSEHDTPHGAVVGTSDGHTDGRGDGHSDGYGSTAVRLDQGHVEGTGGLPERFANPGLPPHVPRMSDLDEKGATLHYLYADTEYCKCVLAGNAQALQAYRDMALPPPAFPADATAPRGINPENLVIRDMDSDFMDLEPDHILNFGF